MIIGSKKCKWCNSVIENNIKLFCNHSCAARYNNKNRIYNPKLDFGARWWSRTTRDLKSGNLQFPPLPLRNNLAC